MSSDKRSEVLASDDETQPSLPRPFFRNRDHAGEVLAKRLADGFEASPGATPGEGAERLVLALPPGGVPVGRKIAEALDAPLDVFLVRRLPLPGDSELAMGAVASGGVRMMNDTVIRTNGLSEEVVARVAKEEEHALMKQESRFRGVRPVTPIAGKHVVLVSDGATTGATLRAAAAAVRAQDPATIVIALPVASPLALQALQGAADRIVCECAPDAAQPFGGVGAWYSSFEEVPEEAVREALEPGPVGEMNAGAARL